MGSQCAGGIVLKFDAILAVAHDSGIATSTGERALNSDGRIGVSRQLVVPRADVLETCFVNRLCAQYLCVADLEGVFVIGNIVSLGLQRKLRNSAVGLLLAVEHVAYRQ